MVTDAKLVERLREFLRTSDLTTTTTATVRRRLEEDFAVDLTDKKAFIREQVDLFLSELENEKDDADADEEVEEEEEGDNNEESRSGGEEEDEEAEKSNGGSSTKKGRKKPSKEVKKSGGGGFTKLCSLSPQLQEFVGVSELARTGVVKKLWAYIRENNLQDPKNRRKILCDDRLQTLFNVDVIDMFQMNKVLARHIWPLNSEDDSDMQQTTKGNIVASKKFNRRTRLHPFEGAGFKTGTLSPAKSTQKEKRPKKEREGSEESPKKGKRLKGGTSGLMAPLQLSDALVKFIGTGENELSRPDVIKRIWDYIKQNNLQNPADKKNILCDDKLKKLLDVDSFTGFTVSKLLAAHFIKSQE